MYGKSFQWYEYLTIGGIIPRFKAIDLDLGLHKRLFKEGSFIKLYSYDMPRGCRSDICWDLWSELNQYLFDPEVQITLYEKRERYKKHESPIRTMSGNKVRLENSSNENIEKTLAFDYESNEIGKLKIQIYVFKHGYDTKSFTRNKPIVFTVNGQTHATLTKSFISQDCQLHMLNKSILVHIDCTKIRVSFRQDMFMSSRDRLKEGAKTEAIKDILTSYMRCDELRQLNHERKEKLVNTDNSNNHDLLMQVANKIPFDRDILKILNANSGLTYLNKNNESQKGGTKNNDRKSSIKQSHYRSKRFPAIFKIKLKENKDDSRIVKSIPLNGKGVIDFETDVQEDYFFRSKESGELKLEVLKYGRNTKHGGGPIRLPNEIADIFDVTKAGPIDNSIKITFKPKSHTNVGDEIKLNATLTSPDGDLESVFWVRIVDPTKSTNSPKPNKENKLPNLPKPIKVYQNPHEDELQKGAKSWEDYSWDANDIVQIFPADDSQNKKLASIEAIAVNMDSHALKKDLKSKAKNERQILGVKNRYFLQTYWHSLMLHSTFLNIDKKDDGEENSPETHERIALAFQRYAPFLLSFDPSAEFSSQLEASED